MIGPRAESVTALLERYRAYRNDKQLNEQLQNRAGELDQATKALQSPAQQIALQRDRGWITAESVPTEEFQKVYAAVERIRQLLAEDPGKINSLVARVVSGCVRVAESATDASQIAWDDVLKRKQPSVDETELKRCEQFTSEAATIGEIRKLTRVSVKAPPADLTAWHEIETRWERLRELIGKLPKSSDNPDVIRFLDAVRKGGAPLQLLTDSVRQYLEETGKTAMFRIYQDR